MGHEPAPDSPERGRGPLPPAERQSTFDAIYREYRQRLYDAIARKFVRFVREGGASGNLDDARTQGGLNRDDAENVLQDSFQRLWVRLGEDAPHEPVKWLFKVALRQAIDLLKQMRRRRDAALRRKSPTSAARKPGVKGQDDAPSSVGGPPDAMQSGQLTAAIHREELRGLKAALAKLPPEDRRIIERLDIDGATCEEVASDLGCSAAALRKRLQRLRKAFRSELARTNGSTFIPEADADTRERERPRDRAGAIRAIAALPKDTAEILALRYVERLLPSQIARRTGESLASVQERLLRAEKNFRKRYDMTVNELRAVLEPDGHGKPGPEKGA